MAGAQSAACCTAHGHESPAVNLAGSITETTCSFPAYPKAWESLGTRQSGDLFPSIFWSFWVIELIAFNLRQVHVSGS